MTWTLTRRETGLLEHVCEHGVGHPNYASALWQAEGVVLYEHHLVVAELQAGDGAALVDEEMALQLCHGCCGCCKADDFPGRNHLDSLRHAHRLIREHKTFITYLRSKLAEKPKRQWRRDAAAWIAMASLGFLVVTWVASSLGYIFGSQRAAYCATQAAPQQCLYDSIPKPIQWWMAKPREVNDAR